MSASDPGRDGPPGRPSENEAARPAVAPYQKQQILLITGVALGLYVAVRLLPAGSNVNHMDFRVEGKGGLEFCDPANPQFIPVVAVRSPVVMTLQSDRAPARDETVEFTLTLRTASGKPIGPADLLVAHTRKLHVLAVDPTLTDYQHMHPEPGRRDGEWKFSFTPTRAGLYRFFADFTPAATQRGLYASADFNVQGPVATVITNASTTYQERGYNFELLLPQILQAGRPSVMRFRIESQGAVKTPVKLEPVMGAYAHLVTFDETRSGFAHLHPMENDLTKPPDALRPQLDFKVTIPASGRYVIWAQVKIDGKETFAPYWVDVLP